MFVLGFASLINSLTSGKTDVSPFLSFSDVSALFIKMGKKCHNASTGYLFVNPWLTTDRPYTMYASRSRCGLRGLEPFRSGVLRGCCAGAARESFKLSAIHFRFLSRMHGASRCEAHVHVKYNSALNLRCPYYLNLMPLDTHTQSHDLKLKTGENGSSALSLPRGTYSTT